MTSTSDPGLRHQSRTRTVLRLLGLVLLLGGLYLVLTGGMAFLDSVDDARDESGFGPILRLGAGGFLCVAGLGLLNAGFLGAQSRYVAGETAPVLRDSAAYLSSDRADERGPGSAPRGPYCRGCGTRNDQDARFCDSCGSALA